MSRIRHATSPGGRPATGRPANRIKATEALMLAAAPTFVLMALVTAWLETGPAAVMCAGAGGIPLGGMTAMYLLMAVFHAAPWLRLAGFR